ncbi:MAG: DUF1272 domain-containing protein [Pseudomonadales bacterium]|nr:DUF1272 domain-containing protein [Pseudomonadales bacterium]MDP6472806.1 DUF1272 domain-containing protein [Pseudomonadales bacterium]MDP6828022.1 DUF1272 domain-containing protein [Pseudomonadales bacterium]MDP6970578.1 DUF1272 domain-containing protein [Pseudomonadales bacterium]
MPPDAVNVVICSFECTFCSDRAQGVLGGRCPKRGGNFQPRPIRPTALLERFPASTERIYNPQHAAGNESQPPSQDAQGE